MLTKPFYYLAILLTLFLSGCNNGDKGLLSSKPEESLLYLIIEPQVHTLPQGFKQQYTATALFSDNHTLEVTNDTAISWRTSDPTIATISNSTNTKGLLTAINEGQVQIIASGFVDDKTFEATAQLTVTNSVVTDLFVEPLNTNIAQGFEQQYTATALFSDNHTLEVTNDTAISWRTSDPTIATISNSTNTKGLLTAINEGQVQIIASGVVDGKTFEATAQLTVTNSVVTDLFVEPLNTNIAQGFEQQYTATALFSDNHTLEVTNDTAISWRTSDPTIATISNSTNTKGLLTAIKEGQVQIIASGFVDDKTFEATAQLTVTNSVVTDLFVEPLNTNIAQGFEQQYTATALFSDNHTLEVTNDTAISWRTSDPTIATISNSTNTKGLLTAINEGQVQIIASGVVDGKTFEATAQLTVTNSVVTDLFVEPLNTNIAQGFELQYTATALFSDNHTLEVTNDTAISWRTSDPTIATISNSTNTKGLLTAINEGQVQIIASGVVDGKTFEATAQLTVTNSVVTDLFVEPLNTNIAQGFELQYTATALFSDNHTLEVTNDTAISWRTSDPTIATISNSTNTKGLLTAINEGQVQIIASGVVDGKTFEATAQLTVTNSVVTDLFVEPLNTNIAQGFEQQYAATALFSDNHTLEVTNDTAISWRTSDPTIATISNSTNTKGLLTAINEGQVQIIASGVVDGKTFETAVELNVTPAIVTNIIVEPTEHQLPVGFNLQFNAMAVFSNGSILDITTNASTHWRSSDPGLATIDSLGFVRTQSSGEVEIIAFSTVDGSKLEGRSNLTITEAVVVKLDIDSPAISLPTGLDMQYRANALFSDNHELDVTNNSALNWSTSDPNIAVISNLTGNKGGVIALKVGKVNVIASGTANGEDFKASVELEVTAPLLEDISLSATDITVTEYYSVQLNAFGHYSDGTVSNLTSVSTWHPGSNIRVVNGSVTATNFISGYVSTVSASFDGLASPETQVNMVSADRSPVIGMETPYKNEVSSDIHSEISFQGSAVIDGIYDSNTGELLAGGYGGGENTADINRYSDVMFLNDVTFISAIYGTAWSSEPMLQVINWEEDTLEKVIGKLHTGTSVEVMIDKRVLGIIIYSSAPTIPRYVSGIQFIYR